MFAWPGLFGARQPRFWWLYVAEILERHDLADAAREPVDGVNPTHPTFLCGDIVVKLRPLDIVARASRGRARGACPEL